MAAKSTTAKTDTVGRRVKKKGEPPMASYAEKNITPTMERYIEYIESQTGYTVDPMSVQLGSALRTQFQKSPENQKHLADRKAAKAQEQEQRKAARAERAQASKERAAAKAAKTSEPKVKTTKAPAKAKATAAKKPATAKATPAKKTTATKTVSRRRPATKDDTDF